MAVIAFEWATTEAVAQMKLREADIVEIGITNPGVDPYEVLMLSVEQSYFAELVRVDGAPALVYGVAQTGLYGCGVVWMLSSDGIYDIRRYFVKNCREKVDMMNRMFPVLFNYVHDKNTVSKNWLRWLGFEIQQPDERGMCYFRRGVN